MKILSTGFYPKWQCHFIAECNFIEEHLAAGDEVSVLQCDASLKACDANPGRALPECLVCMGMRQSAVECLSSPIASRPLISIEVKAQMKSFTIPKFSTLDELRGYTCDGLQIGQEILSSLVTATGSTTFSIAKHAELVRNTIRDFIAAYLTAIQYLEQYGYDMVYVFNGRFACPRAWIRACEKTQTDYIMQERMGMPDRVHRVKNGSVHETLRYGPLINDFWEKNRHDPDVVREARDFFEERPKGQLTGWYSFVSTQKAGCLPDLWDAAKRNIAIFSSSEGEFAGLPEFFKGSPFQDQKKAYVELAKTLRKMDRNMHFYLRVHPNSQQDQVRWWEDPEWGLLDNLTVIPPESLISSYELLQQCEKTVVFMTTMGIEATYWGKPCMVLSNAMYCGTDAVYEPKNLQEAADLVATSNQPPKPKDHALAYGAFIRCGYPKLPFSEALDHCTLTFKGQRPNAHPEVLKSLWNWENIIRTAAVPSLLKQLWQHFEWNRLHFKLKGNFDCHMD
ncbi:MAG: hypothetical protein D4R65_02055 [Verrucomicrobiaceae bacterium]|nr:MAG: hypothetical protein D4R65_02055 [Verrucomicrobiaceae bacterium]